MDIITKIDDLRKQRKWSVNYLAMEAGITQSTLSSIMQRKSLPKIETLQSLCEAFGITLSQFFVDDEQSEILTVTEKELLTEFRKLPEYKQQAILKLLK